MSLFDQELDLSPCRFFAQDRALQRCAVTNMASIKQEKMSSMKLVEDFTLEDSTLGLRPKDYPDHLQ